MTRRLASISVCMALWMNAEAATLLVDQQGVSGDRSFKSIAAALTQLSPGDTLLITEGVYRETVDLRKIKFAADAPRTVIAATADGKVTIKGSDVVTGWTQLENNVYAKREWRTNSQQVFVNGKSFKQIGGYIFGGYPNPRHAFASMHASQGGIWPGRVGNDRGDMTAESFYYDANAKILYIRTAARLTERDVVEVSVRPYLAIGNGIVNVEFRDLYGEHANTTDVSQSGAISINGDKVVLKNIDIRHVDGAGIDLTGAGNRVERSVANYCGSVGMKVRGRNARLLANETSFNNTRGFNKWWEAGGAKFVGDGGLQDSEVTAHRAYANNGDGLWFDWRNDNNRIHHNVLAYNRGMGLHYEASYRADIRDNYVVGNEQRGIYLPNSSRSVVENNLVAANKMEAIVVIDERGAAEKGPEDFVPRDNRVADNVIAWNGKAALVLPARQSGSKSDDSRSNGGQAGDGNGNRSDGNVFVGNAPTLSLGWQPLVHGLDAWRERSGQDASSRWRWLSMSSQLSQQLNSHKPLSPEVAAEWRNVLQSLDVESNARARIATVVDQLAASNRSP